jgi:hypothetical protein
VVAGKPLSSNSSKSPAAEVSVSDGRVSTVCSLRSRRCCHWRGRPRPSPSQHSLPTLVSYQLCPSSSLSLSGVRPKTFAAYQQASSSSSSPAESLECSLARTFRAYQLSSASTPPSSWADAWGRDRFLLSTLALALFEPPPLFRWLRVDAESHTVFFSTGNRGSSSALT